jgi:hypothetical protein
MRWCVSSASASARMNRASEVKTPWRSPMDRHGSSIFCGVAQRAVHGSHEPAGGGASPPATSKFARGPRDFGDRVTNADRSGSTPLTGANSYPRRRNFGAGPPKAGCECSTHSVGAISPLKHIEMCSALVMRRQLVQIQPSAPDALQALTAERRIRNPEVDRAIRSWGTSSLGR